MHLANLLLPKFVEFRRQIVEDREEFTSKKTSPLVQCVDLSVINMKLDCHSIQTLQCSALLACPFPKKREKRERLCHRSLMSKKEQKKNTRKKWAHGSSGSRSIA